MMKPEGRTQQCATFRQRIDLHAVETDRETICLKTTRKGISLLPWGLAVSGYLAKVVGVCRFFSAARNGLSMKIDGCLQGMTSSYIPQTLDVSNSASGIFVPWVKYVFNVRLQLGATLTPLG